MLNAVFQPRRIALVGASERPGAMGELFWRNLGAGFPGEVVPVSASAATVFGVPAYPTLRDAPGDIDLAVIVVPAAAVPAVVADAAAKGVRAALVIGGGFAETGPDGARLQAEMVEAARAGGVQVVGPNCFGVQNCDLPLNASMARGLPRGTGGISPGISMVTQSGAYGMALHGVAIDERARFAKVCSTGNKADVGDTDLLDYLGADPATRTLCFFLESLPDGRAFIETAAALAMSKPVIVARTGRSAGGARAALSHTAALAGSERIWRAAFDRVGVVLARSGLELLDAARALDSQPVPAGYRVAIVTNSGGTGVELTDLLADEGLLVPELSPALQEDLRKVLPPFASPANPVDMTPVWSRYAELYPLLIDRLARSGEVDIVLPVLLQRSASDPAVAEAVRDAVARLRSDDVTVPVYACWVAARADRRGADLLQDAGLPCFEWPERTARAVGHAARYGAARERVRPIPPAPPRPPGLPERLPIGLLAPDLGAEVLTAARIPIVESVTVDTAEQAIAAAEQLCCPVVLKAVHPDLVHKSDVGGVRLNLTGPGQVAGAATDLLALAPGATLQVQRQVRGVEVVVGGVRDPQFGPMVMVGLGGVLVEVVGDVVFGVAPLDRAEALRLIDSLPGRGALAGAGGAEAVDLDTLADVLTTAGDLMSSVPEIAELDLNPVLATADGCVAVDWRVRVEFSPGQDE